MLTVSLLTHNVMVAGDKPYQCDICAAAFSDPSSRRRHLKEHDGLKPYTCQLCRENFKRAGQLKAHLNKKHLLNKAEIVIAKPVGGFQFEACGQVQTIILDANDEFAADESASPEDNLVERSSVMDSADDNHIIVAQTRLSELAEDGEEQQRQLIEETQRLVQQIQSQLDGASSDGQTIHVAYQIMRDEDNQPILEIQYQPAQQDGGNVDGGALTEQPTLDGEDRADVWGEGEQQTEQPGPGQTGASQELLLVQSEDSLSVPNNDSGIQPPESVVIPSLTVQHGYQHVDAPHDHVAMTTTSHDEQSSEPQRNNLEHSVSPSPSAEHTVDFVHHPDFASQDYYNWLSNFTEACRATPLPLSAELFHDVSHVHKSLADVLAMPTGILADKSNFCILMSISRELNEVISEHLTYILEGLKDSEK